MKRGRPTNHTSARWVTFTKDNKELFFELNKGKLVTEKKLQPHHTKDLKSQTIVFPKAITKVPQVIEKAESPAETQVSFIPPEEMYDNYDGFELEIQYNITTELSEFDFCL